MVVLASCNGLATKGHEPMVFALNLSSQPVSLTLGKEGSEALRIDSLQPRESRPLTRLPRAEGVILRQGPAGAGADREWTDPSGTPYALSFSDGQLYALIVDPQGQAAVYALPETYSSDPKLCIINASPDTLVQVQVAPAWARNVKVYSQDVAPVVPSEFYSFAPKTLGLYWQTKEQAAAGAHTDALGLDGRPLRTSFEAGRYYLFLAGDGAVRDLTPTLD